MRAISTIIAVGGGGFTHETDPDLDEFYLDQLPPAPALGFIGMASGDAPEKIDRFYDRFRGRATFLSHLPATTTRSEARDWLAGKDLVYFGGGNTATLINRLRSVGLVGLLRRANEQGIVLAGVSAGGACWFDWVLSNSAGAGYTPLTGLGFIRSGVCPHYLDEPARRPVLEALVVRDSDLSCYAIDDGACIIARSGKVIGYFSARVGAAAYQVQMKGGKVDTNEIPRYAGCLSEKGTP
ncbi:MAG: Type 1 glutamine amidotransferase-like domain-containing protein [Geminicoccaceae bacterium]